MCDALVHHPNWVILLLRCSDSANNPTVHLHDFFTLFSQKSGCSFPVSLLIPAATTMATMNGLAHGSSNKSRGRMGSGMFDAYIQRETTLQRAVESHESKFMPQATIEMGRRTDEKLPQNGKPACCKVDSGFK
jgi:hypothetical protein